MAPGWNRQWKRAGRDEEAKSTRPAPDPGSRAKHPQVCPFWGTSQIPFPKSELKVMKKTGKFKYDMGLLAMPQTQISWEKEVGEEAKSYFLTYAQKIDGMFPVCVHVCTHTGMFSHSCPMHDRRQRLMLARLSLLPLPLYFKYFC